MQIKSLELQEIYGASVEPLKTYTKEEIEEMNVEGIMKKLKAAEDLIKLAKPNLNAIQVLIIKINIIPLKRKK